MHTTQTACVLAGLSGMFFCSAPASSVEFSGKPNPGIENVQHLDGLLTAIVTWLSETAELPAIYEHPKVEFLPAGEIARRHKLGVELKTWRVRPVTGAVGSDRAIVSAYSTKTRTIYLPKAWAGVSAAEISVLVHEVAHHLQTAGSLKYACPAAREAPAYTAQERWLEFYGTSLKNEFEIDDLTLLVLTKCAPP